MTEVQKAMAAVASLCDELAQGMRISTGRELADVLEAFADHGCAGSRIGHAIDAVYRAIQDEDDAAATVAWEHDQAEQAEMRALFPWQFRE